MKVLFVTTCYPSKKLPQYCIFLEQQALALQKRGYIVDVLHIKNHADNEMGVSLQHGVKVIRRFLTTKKTKLDVLFPYILNEADSDAIHNILENGYDVVSFHMGDLRLLRTLCKQCHMLNIPLIQHFHGLGIWQYHDNLHPLLTSYTIMLKKRIYSGLSGAVGVSNKVRKIFEKKIRTVPTYTVYNGVDIQRFPMDEQRCFFKDGTVKIICVANLIPIKGQKYLIEATAELQSMGKNIRLTFAGRGPDEKALKSLAGKLNVPADFVGYLPYDEISVLMREQDLFIMPSYYEALGCVYLEAMSAGMLTVGVKGQGIDEIIQDGKNGYLVEPKSVESIVEVVIRILNTEQGTLKKVALCARETSMRFTWDVSAEMLDKVYHEVVVEKRKKYE